MSCLFNSLSYFINENSYDIRQKICNYLAEAKPLIDGFDTQLILQFENPSAQAYIDNMRNSSTWGGAIEIQAACNIWNLTIRVANYRDRTDKHIEFIPVLGSSQRIINIYWTGGHFEPIRN